MAKNTNQHQSGFGTKEPGQECCALDASEGAEAWGLVSLYASVPSRGFLPSSFVRFNLFADVSGTREHVASAICPSGTVGELISVSGHAADTWHVTVQATSPRQDMKVSLIGNQCCAQPKVEVRADLLTLAFAPVEAGVPAELQWFPMVPWGGAFGAAQAFTVTGTGVLAMPKGARLTHWLAEGTGGPPNTVRFDNQAAGQLLNVGNAAPAREGFPAAQYVTSIAFQNLLFGLFEIVV